MTDNRLKDRIYALAITGPTASGKTALSILLAKVLSAEIISLDSMQIYKGMDIGTAKPTEEERKGVRHHLIDFLLPGEKYSAQAYKTDAMRVAREILDRGRLPIFVGGTGLYLDTLMRKGTGALVPESSEEYKRERLSKIKTDEDKHALWEYLRAIDPESAEKTHENNVRRVIRAVEVYEKTGMTKSHFDTLASEPDPEISLGVITLDFHNREALYSRINKRVDMMISEGLLEEARELYSSGTLSSDNTSSQAIGYKELVSYLEGRETLDEAIEKIKLETRRYAKRQLTWYRHCDAVRIYMDNEDGEMRPTEEIFAECRAVADDLLSKIRGENNFLLK